MDFIFSGSKITVDGDCSHKIKRCKPAPWKESYDKPRQVLKKQRPLLIKVCMVKAMVFPGSQV